MFLWHCTHFSFDALSYITLFPLKYISTDNLSCLYHFSLVETYFHLCGDENEFIHSYSLD